MLTTGSMIKIGKTYENFMIDLMPTNEKLKDRAIRIVSEIAAVKTSVALQTLLESGWNVKTSILMLVCKLSRTEAEELLRKNCGVLRRALNNLIKA
jgi:N-acetylmuramic acid 6-phosphate etherase